MAWENWEPPKKKELSDFSSRTLVDEESMDRWCAHPIMAVQPMQDYAYEYRGIPFHSSLCYFWLDGIKYDSVYGIREAIITKLQSTSSLVKKYSKPKKIS